MERKCALTIICIVSTILIFPHGAKSKPGNVNVDVKVNVNGKKVIDESHPKKPDGKNSKNNIFNTYIIHHYFFH